MNRRRFLCLSAAALLPAAGQAATVTEWQGWGLGATLSLRLVGADPYHARQTFARVQAEVQRIEKLASLHCDSSLTRLNRDGHLAWPAPGLTDLLTLAGQVHAATGGVFDPTIQPLWRAIAEGRPTAAARALVGWGQVSLSPSDLRLGRGQEITLNGIAQGWAADQIAALLRAQGFTNALIDMGEVATLGQRPDGRPWRARIAAPDGAALAEIGLSNRALATSSPRGTLIGDGRPHILGPQGQPPLWQTASVSAASAAVADALSTAFCLMDRTAIATALSRFPDARLEALA